MGGPRRPGAGTGVMGGPMRPGSSVVGCKPQVAWIRAAVGVDGCTVIVVILAVLASAGTATLTLNLRVAPAGTFRRAVGPLTAQRWSFVTVIFTWTGAAVAFVSS